MGGRLVARVIVQHMCVRPVDKASNIPMNTSYTKEKLRLEKLCVLILL